ncbi:hypothetical protein [Oceanivirga salmonicida]|uniref:hypothetical protein n=1 Tax=Oceanivirga salmonicida TaxID=1769291 RepID=UPI0012E0D687|nr:hypothetical protein [Oceanivirga salmonicida]
MKKFENLKPLVYEYLSSYDETLKLEKRQTVIDVQDIYDKTRKDILELLGEKNIEDITYKFKYTGMMMKEMDYLSYILSKEGNRVILSKVNDDKYIDKQKKKLIIEILKLIDMLKENPLDYELFYIYDEIKNHLVFKYMKIHMSIAVKLVRDDMSVIDNLIDTLINQVNFLLVNMKIKIDYCRFKYYR